MKVVAFCCIVLLLVWAGCKKNTKPSSQNLIGTWELHANQSSIMPLTAFPPGNGNLLTFTDHSYSITKSGQVLKTGNYTVAEDHSFSALVVPEGQFIHRIDYQDSVHQKIFFQINGDTLTFLTGVFALDGGVMLQYMRKSD
jgi:hypothetical protein